MNHYPAIFLVTNLHHTIWYKMEENNRLEKLTEHEEGKEVFSDHEGSFRSAAGTGSSEIMNKERDEHEKKYLHTVAEKTKDLLETEKPAYFLYSAPEMVKNELRELLKPAIKDTKNKYLVGNHVNSDEGKILELFHDSLKAY